MPASEFDRFFLHLPPFDRESDFDAFWNSSFAELKKIPIEPKFEPKKHGPTGFRNFDVSFRSHNKSVIQGELSIPKGAKKPRVVIVVPDYNRPNPYAKYALEHEIAYFFIQLRGHDLIRQETPEGPASPGYMVDGIDDLSSYYLRGVYLDVFRSIDALRLNGEIDCSAIGIIGKGLGSAAALFAASYSNRVAALVLDTPSLCYLTLSQNISTGDATREINEYLEQHKTRKKAVKKNLTYFDGINFSDRIRCSTLTTVGFRDTISPPECVFALFNHLLCDKTIEVYPEDGNRAGEEKQFRKSLKWIAGIVNGA
ncbi:MAG: hypothetical protein EPN93_00295 [Spirochaetes bacterium]|nr:MAG: hypothetical protein EPN93_00295 [Spirochaetota bacterium]